jgi:hypothetical protein
VAIETRVPSSTSPTFAERLRAAKEQQERQARRRSPRQWFRGPRANFAPDIAVEPGDRPRPRDELAVSLRDAG